MVNDVKNSHGLWNFFHFDTLGEDNFTRLCLRLLRCEISPQIQPTNRKGPDDACDAFLLPASNNRYSRKGLWQFQFKFKEFGRAINTGRKLKDEFKRDFKKEIEKVIKKERLPETYLIITDVELSGRDWSDWMEKEIKGKYDFKIPYIECWDFSKLNTLLDEYLDIKRDFESIIRGTFLPSSVVIDVKKPNKIVHLLQNAEVKFTEKLSYIFDLINNLEKPRPIERTQTLEIIKNNNNLAWHFFRNLKNPAWFPEIKDNLIKSVVVQNVIDAPVKYQLLSYFEVCSEQYTDEIIPLITELDKNTGNANIRAAIVKTIAKLKPNKKTNLKPIWQTLEKLVEHQYPWLRKEIPPTLKALAKYDINKSLKILGKMFLFSHIPQDVTQGSPTLSITFQGRDNENLIFEETVTVLSDLMSDNRFVSAAYQLAINLIIRFIRTENEKLNKKNSIVLDHSHAWLPDKDPLKDFKYNYEREERFALEIERRLDEYVRSNEQIARSLIEKLLQENYEIFILIVIRVLTRYTEQYLDLAEQIIFNSNLWAIYNINKYFLQSLVEKYFEVKQDRLEEYIDKVMSFDEGSDQKNYLKQNLLVAIPEKYRNDTVKDELNKLSQLLRSPAHIEKPKPVFTLRIGPQPDISIEELRGKTDDELIEIMEVCTENRRRADTYDLAPVFANLIKESPDKFINLLDKVKDRNISLNFIGEMTKSFIEVKNKNLKEILDIFWKLRENYTWAKIEIVRFLNIECRKKEITQISPDLLKELKRVLFALASDADPGDDEGFKSDKPKPINAINRGINSVRGITTEVLVALICYFPKDQEFAKKIKELAEDKTNAVKATLIYNLQYLIRENYKLCKTIVDQFKSIRAPETDFALIHYFSYLGPKDFQANKSFLKLLFSNSDGEIQRNLGEMIGFKYVDNYNITDMVESIIRQERATKEARWGLALVFESMLPKLLAEERQERLMKYYIKLLEPQNDPGLVERTSFVFERDELKPQYFKIIDKYKLPDEVIKNIYNIPAQYHLINYICRCVTESESINRCIEILHKQITEIEGILSDHLIVQKIAEIIKHTIDMELDKKTKGYIEDIFDKGLERGWNEFYEVFEARYLHK